MAYTSAHMKPCKGPIAERHNKRLKELEYIRKELTHLNTYKEWKSIDAQMEKIRTEYLATTGQKLQSSAQPIQEIVLVTGEDTTKEHLEKFCKLIRGMGMTPLSYAIHKDEGHYDAVTKEWIPNYHAHIIVDTTCWEHKEVLRTKKVHGKNVIDPKTKKPVKIRVDGYAKTIKFTPRDMALLQDYAAEATGLDRGVSSDRVHEDARRYKARAQAQEIETLARSIDEKEGKIKELAQAIREKEGEVETLKTVVDMKQSISDQQEKKLAEQYAALAKQEKAVRDCAAKLKLQAESAVKDFDKYSEALKQYKIAPDNKVCERRDRLEKYSSVNLAEFSVQDLATLAAPITDMIMIIAMYVTSMAMALSNSISRTIEERKRTLEALTRNIKEQPAWKATGRSVGNYDSNARERIIKTFRDSIRENPNFGGQKNGMRRLPENASSSTQIGENARNEIKSAFVLRPSKE